MSLAGDLWPENPLLAHVPDDAGLPVIYFEGGNYARAAATWEERIRGNGCSPELCHMLAITCQCLLEESSGVGAARRLELLEKANMYWSALTGKSEYWLRHFQERQEIYQGKAQLRELVTRAPALGLEWCDLHLHELQQESEKKSDSELGRPRGPDPGQPVRRTALRGTPGATPPGPGLAGRPGPGRLRLGPGSFSGGPEIGFLPERGTAGMAAEPADREKRTRIRGLLSQR